LELSMCAKRAELLKQMAPKTSRVWRLSGFRKFRRDWPVRHDTMKCRRIAAF